MKLHPRSSARLSAASESASDCVPHEPPMAQAPKPISEQLNPCLPKGRYCIGILVNWFGVPRHEISLTLPVISFDDDDGRRAAHAPTRRRTARADAEELLHSPSAAGARG